MCVGDLAHYAARSMVEGWFYITAALLALSGGLKIRDSDPTQGALKAAGLPASRSVVVGLGCLEIAAAATGLAGLVVGAALVAALYAGFVAFVGVAAARKLPIQSCGCFGRADTPPTIGHLLINALAVVTAGLVATRGGAELAATMSEQPARGLPYLFFVGTGVFLVALILSELPAVTRKSRGLAR